MFNLAVNHINRVLTGMSEGLNTELKSVEEHKNLSVLTYLVEMIQSTVAMSGIWCGGGT